MSELERIAEMATRQRRIVKIIQRDLAERHVGPQVVMTSGERIAQRVTSGFRITGLPELDALLVIRLHFLDAARVNQLEGPVVQPRQADCSMTVGPRAGSRAV